jgi:hypothetical protein
MYILNSVRSSRQRRIIQCSDTGHSTNFGNSIIIASEMSRACDAPHMKTHSKIFHQTTLFGDPSGVSLAQFSRFVTTFGCRPTNCGPLTTLREWRRANKRPWRRVSSPMAHRAGSIGEHYYIITLLHYYNVVTLFADEPPQQLYI